MPCRWFLFCPVFRPMLRWVAVQGPTGRRTGPRYIPPSIPPIVVKAWMILQCKIAVQDAFQAVFPSISRGVWRHFRVVTGLFIYLSGIKALLLRRNCGRFLRRSPLAAELLSSRSKPLERRAVFAYPVCALRFGRDRGGLFACRMSGHSGREGNGNRCWILQSLAAGRAG